MNSKQGMGELQGMDVRGYKILEQIGSGGYGAVYRAEQPSVGRHVAIKVIHPELAEHPEFTSRFETEARTIARLEHPHIIPIHDYWSDDRGAFLVMRLVEWGSLRVALSDGPLGLAAVADILDQIAAALTVAHKQGVIHRDIKPENILLDQEGHAYLTDFGIAKDLAVEGQTATGAIVGSVDYMAPEQAKSEAVGAQTDIYGLGLILFEMLSGEHPFPRVTPVQMIQKQLYESVPNLSEQRPDLPDGIDRVIERATAKDPADRYSNVAEMLAEFEQLVAGPRAQTEASGSEVESPPAPSGWPILPDLPLPPNPYRGLAAFREEHAPFFFGRESFVEALLERLEGDSILNAVVGSSGSGKSSVVYAGLIPRIRAQGGWLVMDTRPGTQPLDSLARLLVPLLDPQLSETAQLIESKKLARSLESGELALLEVVSEVIAKSDSISRLLLVIDQFEELYTLCSERDKRRAFIGLLLEALNPVPDNMALRLVLTLRADFMGRALAHRAFADQLQEASLMLGPMNQTELGSAIKRPAEIQGVSLAPGLLKRLLDDVGDEPGNLPLLEFALTLMWDRQIGRRLGHTAYDSIGGVEGALAGHADEVISELNDRQQPRAKRVFMQLVRPGEGTEDTRRQATRDELGDDNWELAQRLADRRLVVTGQNAERQETVEVVHEALIRRWSRLQVWIEEDRAFRSWQERLRSTIQLWNESERDEGVYLRGAPLASAQDWMTQRVDDLSEAEREFIGASLALNEARQAEEERQLRRELEIAREQAAAAERLRRGRRYLIGALGVAILMAGAAGFLGNQARISAERNAVLAEQSERIADSALGLLGEVERERQIAFAGELMARSGQFYESNPQLSLLLAVEALNAARELGGVIALDAEGALYAALTTPTFRGAFQAHDEPINTAQFSPDGSHILTASDDGTARIWTLEGDLIATLDGGASAVLSAQYSPDGSRIVTASPGGAVLLWDNNGKTLTELGGHSTDVRVVRFSPSAEFIITASSVGPARLWARDGELLSTLEIEASSGIRVPVIEDPPYVHFSPDSSQIMLGKSTPDHGSILDLGARLILDFPTETPIRLSPDGRRILTRRAHEGVQLRDGQGRFITTLEASVGVPSDEVVWANFSPDGTHIAGVTSDYKFRLWDNEGRFVSTLIHLLGSVWDFANMEWLVDFSPDGRRLVTPGPDGTVKIWTLDGSLLKTFNTGSRVVTSIQFSPDGSLILSAGSDGTAHLWDADGAMLSEMRGHGDRVNALGFAPRQELVVSGSDDGTVRLWTADGLPVATLGESLSSVLSVDVSRTGAFFGGTSLNGKSYVWNVVGDLEATLELQGDPASGRTLSQPGRFSPDGTYYVETGPDWTIRFWSLEGELLSVLEGHSGPLTSLVFSPDGDRLLSASNDGTARIWNLTDGTVTILEGHSEGINSAGFSPDGELVVTAGKDDSARIWDLRGNQVAVLLGHGGNVLTAAFSPDGERVITGSTDLTARVWSASGALQSVLKGHSGWVAQAAFTPDGSRLITADNLGNLNLWDASGQLLYAFEGHTEAINDLLVSPDGTRVFTASSDGTLRVWELLGDVDWMIGEAKQRAGRSLTPDECQRFLHLDACPAPDG